MIAPPMANDERLAVGGVAACVAVAEVTDHEPGDGGGDDEEAERDRGLLDDGVERHTAGAATRVGRRTFAVQVDLPLRRVAGSGGALAVELGAASKDGVAALHVSLRGISAPRWSRYFHSIQRIEHPVCSRFRASVSAAFGGVHHGRNLDERRLPILRLCAGTGLQSNSPARRRSASIIRIGKTFHAATRSRSAAGDPQPLLRRTAGRGSRCHRSRTWPTVSRPGRTAGTCLSGLPSASYPKMLVTGSPLR